MEIVRLSSKGQIVIPAKIRKELKLSKGDKLLLERKGDVIILRPVVKLSTLRGIDNIEGATEELKRIREEWDKEFEGRL